MLPKATQPHEPIAIIGMGCRFPGAPDVAAFWQLLRDSREAVREIPPERFDIDLYHDPTPGVPGKIVTRRAGLVDDIDQFDAAFFGISPREADSMDPQQRLLLEVSWQALEDGGQVLEKLGQVPVGVFVGTSSGDYGDLQLGVRNPFGVDPYTLPGVARSILAGRLSHILNLHGPSLAIDTACSSSLVAVHQACHSIWRGESALALAGGVNAILAPGPFYSLSMATILSPTGRCRTFDANADGFVRGEGAGMVLLKPLAQAEADGDPVCAVILASASNNDGGGGSVMTPNGQAQEAVLRAACQAAGIRPGEIQYVEAHGTGTQVGDPIELQALGRVMQDGHSRDNPCLIGSVKTNIGHLESAAGIAGLIKVALCLQQRAIPAHLHFEKPNPALDWAALPLHVQTTFTEWPHTDTPARAGVSSFGISGTNVHTILAEPPPPPATKTGPSSMHLQYTSVEEEPAVSDPCSSIQSVSDFSEQQKPVEEPVHLLPVSAHTDEALQATVGRFAGFLSSQNGQVALRDICYSASTRRNHHRHRTTFVGRSAEELLAQMDLFRAGTGTALTVRKAGVKPVFVFSGQGPTFWPLDADFLGQESAFRHSLEACQTLFQANGAGWDLLHELSVPGEGSRLQETDVCQAGIFACQVALAAQWRAWGIEPAAVVGHSLGEVAAAHIAGALTLEQAVQVVLERGRITNRAAGKGAMALVGLPLTKAQALLDGNGSKVAIAANNSHGTCVLSGEPAELDQVLASLHQDDLFARKLPAIDYAAHSPQMEPFKEELAQVLASLSPRTPTVPIYSTVSASLADHTRFDGDYWANNLREPVQFHRTMQAIIHDGHSLFLELHPTQVLVRSIQDTLEREQPDGLALTSLARNRKGTEALLESLGGLWARGCSVRWQTLYPGGARFVGLPHVAWQKKRHWLFDSNEEGAGGYIRVGGTPSPHPLLGWRTDLADQPQTRIYQAEISLVQLPYLADHRVLDEALFPAAGYSEIALAAARDVLGDGKYSVENLTFDRLLFLPEKDVVLLQTVITEHNDFVGVSIYSRPTAQNDEMEERWSLHAQGTVRRIAQSDVPEETEAMADLLAETTSLVSGNEFYAQLADAGLRYGPQFQGVGQVWRQGNRVLAELDLPAPVAALASRYQIHPALLDACFQSVAGAVFQDDVTRFSDLYLPAEIGAVRVYGVPDRGTTVQGEIHPQADEGDNGFTADIRLLDQNGTVLVEVLGLSIRQLGVGTRTAADLESLLYQVAWQQRPLPPAEPGPDPVGNWLIFENEDGFGRAIARQIEAAGGSCAFVRSVVTRSNSVGSNSVGSNSVGSNSVGSNSVGSSSDDPRWTNGDRPTSSARIYSVDESDPAAVLQLLTDHARQYGPVQGIIYLWGASDGRINDLATAQDLVQAQQHGLSGLLCLCQGLAQREDGPPPQLWIARRGGGNRLASAPLTGMARTIALEHPERICRTVDFSGHDMVEQATLLWQEIAAGDGEDQITYQEGVRHVARLVPHTPSATPVPTRPVGTSESYRLGFTAPGSLENLVLEAAERPPLDDGQVEIRVRSAGLNFLDVLSVLGLRPDEAGSDLPLGMECAGTVSRIGPGVSGIKVGDPVLAIAQHSFGAYVGTIAPLVVPKPANLSFQQAAASPVAYLTAYYALVTLGRLRAGERILIHAGAGGVGLAAVHLARKIGAEVYATAGSPQKRAFLQDLGVARVMDSRSLSFADELMAYTDGQGVDLVLNSLAGEAIPAGLSVLRANGRFLEIGKRDIYDGVRLDMGLLRKNIAFFAIDLIPLLNDQADFCGGLLREICRMLAAGELPPLPLVTYPLDRATDAFHYMAQAKQIGKVVLDVAKRPEETKPAAGAVQIRPWPREQIRSHGSYLLTGGLGGIGLQLAQWLAAQGARHLVLLGRSAPDEAAQGVITFLKQQGVHIRTIQADVTDRGQMTATLADIQANMPPLRGVFHLAGVLEDGVLARMSQERLLSVMAPKVVGAWHLHQLTRDNELDLFVLFSSFISLVGAPGQGNYAAANAFLDELARYRLQQGLPALSINWGAWGRVGMASATAIAQQRNRLGELGVGSLEPAEGLALLERALASSASQVSAIDADWSLLYQRTGLPLLADVANADGSPAQAQGTDKVGGLGTRLAELPAEQRGEALATFLCERIAHILRLPDHQIDRERPLEELGMDSLMAYELKHQLDTALGTPLPITLLLQQPTVAGLCEVILSRLDLVPSEHTAIRPEANAFPDGSGFVRNVRTLLPEATLDTSIRFHPSTPSAKTIPNDLFLTGATGFLGTTLLHDLLNRTEARIHCLVRASDPAAGKRRILAALARGYPHFTPDPRRIIAIPGDLTLPRLGLSEADFTALAKETDLVLHCGAVVNWLASYESLKAINVSGTQEVIRLAAHGRSIPLHYISSVAVFPLATDQPNAVFDEASTLDHDGDLVGGYAQSKWVAEKLVRLAQQQGLSVNIYRPGSIGGHSRSGVWQEEDFLSRIIRSWVASGMAPDVDVPLDLVPVDYVSGAVTSLVFDGHPPGMGHTYHLNNANPVGTGVLVDWIEGSGYPLRRLPYQKWRSALLQQSQQANGSVEAVGPLLALPVSEEIDWLSQLPQFHNARTVEALNGLACPPLTEEMFRQYMAQFVRDGLLPAPSRQED